MYRYYLPSQLVNMFAKKMVDNLHFLCDHHVLVSYLYTCTGLFVYMKIIFTT